LTETLWPSSETKADCNKSWWNWCLLDICLVLLLYLWCK